jgi:Squalene-hopene cyclase C-terminal domain
MKSRLLFVLGMAATFGWAAKPTAPEAVQKGLKWLVSTQGRDGGWGQDGGETSFVRTGERLEHSGNDVANTAVAVLALLHAGHSPERGIYAAHSRRGVEFILKSIAQSPDSGLAVTNVRDTQIQRKLGPFIDTFLSSMLLSELDTRIQDPNLAARVRAGLQKCVNKIQQNQQSDGSWNSSGGWAPVIGTSMASRSLAKAKDRGVKVDEKVMARVDKYTVDNLAFGSGKPVATGGARPTGAAPPVALYQGAQALEQLTRSEDARKANAPEIRKMTAQLADAEYVRGFGSMGGEEFFSYLNISESMKRAGGKQWHDWNEKIKTQLVELQNQDGTWAGHHCITGRVAVTGAAILTLMVDQQS